MAKVQLHNKGIEESSPSKDIIRDANKVYTKVDALGRTLRIKLPTFQDNLKYDFHFGKLADTNKRFYDTNKFCLFVKTIDDLPVSFPTTEIEAFALAARLGDEGFAAIMDCVEENAPKVTDENDTEVSDTLKK